MKTMLRAGFFSAICLCTGITQCGGAIAAGTPAMSGLGRAVLADGSLDYRFDGRITRGVLENYLARAITEQDLLMGRGNGRKPIMNSRRRSLLAIAA